ncbi:MAG: coniferyl-alcohol dehydrogenase [Anaerolineae bacterium]
MNLKNKTIVATGISSGIGAATAKLLKERGATVIGLDLNVTTENCDQFIQIDLSKEASIISACSQIKGGIDSILNIAGVPPTMPPIPVLQVNFTGLRMFTELLIPKTNQGSSIVNVASLAGMGWQKTIEQSKALFEIESMDRIGQFCEDHDIDEENCYEFSKEALIVWTMQSWNRWKDKGIRINAVSPSATHTPILSDFMETVAVRAKKAVEGMADRPQPGQPEDIAPIIAFLASDDSRWLNGVNITAGGGLFAATAGFRMGF